MLFSTLLAGCTTGSRQPLIGASSDVLYRAEVRHGITDVAVTAENVLVATRDAIHIVSRRGARVSELKFTPPADFYPVLIGAASPSRFLAHDSERQTLHVFAASGQELVRLPASYAADFAFLLDGDGIVAIEEPRAKQVGLFDLHGSRRAAAVIPFFITALRSEGPTLLVAAYPNEQGGTSMYRMDSDGQIEALHQLQAIGDFDLLPGDAYAVISDDLIEIRSRNTGSMIRKVPVPGAGRFRDIHAALLERGDLVVALSGRGGFDRHRIIWTDRNNRVIHDEEGRGHAHNAVVMSPCSVLIATDDQVRRLAASNCAPES